MRSQILAAAALATLAYTDDTSSTSSATATTGIPATSTFDVEVGSNGLNFHPDNLIASPGDLIHFHFYASNHSVAQSSFDKPCQPIDSGVYSGFFSASGKDESSQVFSMRLNSTDPLWLYCSSGEHCKGGQSMVVNPPSGNDQTISKYRDEAKKADVKNPEHINGGVVHDKPSASTSSASSGASATSATITKSAAHSVNDVDASSIGLLMAVAGVLILF